MAKVEVPGTDPKDIQVSLQEQLLTIKGEKRHEKEEKDERHHRIERSYGAFTRAVRLPVAVDGGKVTAAFKNGDHHATEDAGRQGVDDPDQGRVGRQAA